ncbi:type VI secretion system ATPase TssH [Amorphus orientalis]|uniref:Type VI secretion system protein VasG n=1 Tax=Amorphus orientalis TaxID=649198 RepID=A0AAE3VM88_9HYPH|nr:type VI secretion system ATPase TssH [Amorphus orientalis]MDQ0314271.1 type VI secretion system protein VasG [Amorphus orientalis]
MQPDLKALFARLNPYTKRSLETASGLCVSSSHYEVTIDHLLLVMIDDENRDLQAMLRAFDIDPANLRRALQRTVEGLRSGNSGRPVFSPLLIEWLTDGWIISSVELNLGEIRSGALLIALLQTPGRYGGADWYSLIEQISAREAKRRFGELTQASEEQAGAFATQPGEAGKADGSTGAAPAAGITEDSALGRFTINFTEQARSGRIDPVFCRDLEIQQMIDILGRRRKNNPICVGEPGVGKTAVVEGLALKIAQGDVPAFLQGVELVGLDLGMLQAGAGVKGEFENRLKGIIDEVKASTKPIVLFIDEAHMMIGAGGSAGGSDAANLLKPALARGELKTIAATTWSEYKKYFEKDAALARRFQLVKLDEPTPDQAVTIIRGLRGLYEKSHGVYIRDDAVVAAAKLSARYLSGRQLPDKAVDVLDTASARVKLSISSKPARLDGTERRIEELDRALSAVRRDEASYIGTESDLIPELEAEIEKLKAEAVSLGARWETERGLIEEILALRQKLGIGGSVEEAEAEIKQQEKTADGAVEPAAAPDGTSEMDADEKREAIDALKQKVAELAKVQGHDPLLTYEVSPDAVGQVISDWTGIPVGRMVRDESAAVLALSNRLKERVIGQDQAILAIDEGVRAAKAGLNSPTQPMGVFLFVGPSGVGKTELATAVAETLFGGDRFLTSINMSEFQEKHTLSKLVGSPPGYVGYGEGGILTEAVRQRPYSVVLLDEVEKADLEVMNLFYQVFDKGTLSDGEGRVIDFKNTIVILTSNLATDTLTQMGLADEKPSVDQLVEAIRPELSRHFKPALLARMQIVPFYPLVGSPLAGIVRLKLNKLVRQLRESQKIDLTYSDAVVNLIAARCTEVETGARNIDHIVNRTLRPAIATEILNRMTDEDDIDHMQVDVGEDSEFVITFGAPPEAHVGNGSAGSDDGPVDEGPSDAGPSNEVIGADFSFPTSDGPLTDPSETTGRLPE